MNADSGIDFIFAPGTSPDVIARHEDTPGHQNTPRFTFNDVDRWDVTATNTVPLNQGDSTTLTWSIVPDGTPVGGFSGPPEPAAPSNLISWLGTVYGTNPTSTLVADQPWFSVIQSVFDRWNAVSGVNYVYSAADDGVALSSQAGGVLGTRGDVRISGHYVDGPGNILAYNFFPTYGDMVIDTSDTFLTDTSNNSVTLRNTIAHEFGHGLGLNHVNPPNSTKLMEPFLSTNYDGPQPDDILAVNRGYGDRLEKNGGNDTSATAALLATTATFTQDTLSIDDDSDVDWFKFTVTSGGSLAMTLTPTGSTYQSNTGMFNSLSQSDLTLTVFGTNGTTVLRTVNAGGAGATETLNAMNLPGAGTYFVRVSGTANAAQMYRLNGTITGLAVPAAPEIAVQDGVTNIVDNTGTVAFGTAPLTTLVQKTFTIVNSGTAPLTIGTVTVPTGFVLASPPAATVAAGRTTTFSVRLNTAVAGNFSGMVSFATNDADENPFNFTINGIVTPTAPVTAPEIEVLDGATLLVDGTSTVDFGSVALGATATKTLTIRNLGTAALTLTLPVTVPTGFTVSTPPAATVAAGGSTTMTITMSTASPATLAGGVVITNNDADEGPFNFNVTGVVTAQVPKAPEIEIYDGTTVLVDGTSIVDFGTVAAGGTSTKTFTIRNLGTADLSMSLPVLPAGYTMAVSPALRVLTPGSLTVFTVALNTTNAGTFTGPFSLVNNDADEGPYNLTFTGTVTAAAPTTAFSDNFNRTNSTALGANWTERNGDFTITNQGLQNSSTGTSVATANNVNLNDAIIAADINLGTGTATRDAGLTARQISNGVGSQYWAGIRYSGGQYSAEIYRVINGVWTRLATTSVTSGSAALRFELSGRSLKLYVNGTLTTSATDSVLTTGRIGVTSTGLNTRIDNFSVTQPTAPLTASNLAVLDLLLAQWDQQSRGSNGNNK
ncbi:choice-of-anchor D domain-containing protein [Anatilimnocola floriformis]|uniref:choice-of-anchor D domain-containing protein n=1 Tax=Anatilimnocola floriformis TaxID=2948575 RepID=UPI0020C1C2F0|nr:choice-of-anchor D domain-containing protein [Anatilimnocola floriformis]